MKIFVLVHELPDTFNHMKTEYDSRDAFECAVYHGIWLEGHLDNEEMHQQYFNMFGTSPHPYGYKKNAPGITDGPLLDVGVDI